MDSTFAIPSAVSIRTSKPTGLVRPTAASICVTSMSIAYTSEATPTLGDQQHIEPWAFLHNFDDVTIHVMSIQTIDANHHCMLAPVDVIECRHDIGTRPRFIIRCHRILEIQENDIGRAARRLLE